MDDLFVGKPLLRKNGSKVDGGEAVKGKIVGLYFSAMWCPSCRQFTPKLVKFYNALKEANKNLEIILVSRDREEDDLLEYLEHNGDWLAIPFGDERIPKFLESFQVPTIPAFKILNPDGTIAIDQARFDVQDKGKENPLVVFDEWEKKITKSA